MQTITKTSQAVAILFFPVFIVLSAYWITGKFIVKQIIKLERGI